MRGICQPMEVHIYTKGVQMDTRQRGFLELGYGRPPLISNERWDLPFPEKHGCFLEKTKKRLPALGCGPPIFRCDFLASFREGYNLICRLSIFLRIYFWYVLYGFKPYALRFYIPPYSEKVKVSHIWGGHGGNPELWGSCFPLRLSFVGIFGIVSIHSAKKHRCWVKWQTQIRFYLFGPKLCWHIGTIPSPIIRYLTILCALFGMVKWSLQRWIVTSNDRG